MSKHRRRHKVPLSTSGVGVNLSGLEWNSALSRTSLYGLNYSSGSNVPAIGFIKWLSNQGVTTVRVPFCWEFMQPVLFDRQSAVAQGNFPYVKAPGDLHSEMVYVFKRLLDECAKYGVGLVLDCHNYGTYYETTAYGATGANNGATQKYYTRTDHFKYSLGYSSISGTPTFTSGSTNITLASGSAGLLEPVKFSTTGTLPANITADTIYYVTKAISTTAGSISATPGGSAITFADAGTGTHSMQSPASNSAVALTFSGGTLTAAHLSNLFTKLVNTFDAHTALVGYGLMNEVPSNVSEATWVGIANQTIAAIRTAGSTKAVFVDGPYVSYSTTTYTADKFTTIVDSANNTYREIHQYLDANRSGAYSGWEYDQKRGFCVDLPLGTYTGVATPVAGVRAQALGDAQRVSGRKVWIGETAFLNTHDRYLELAKLFVRSTRQQSTGGLSLQPVLWGTSSLPWFPKDYRIEPKMHAGQVVPDPSVSIVLNDAGVENAVLCAYVDVATNTLTVEAVGSLTSKVDVTVSCSDAGVTLSKTTLTIKPGVQSYDTLTFGNPVAATAVFSFTASRLTAPSSVTVLNYTDSGSDALQGQRALQRTKSSVFFAGSGRSNFAGDQGHAYEAMVPNSGLSNTRMGLRTLTAHASDKVPLVEGSNRLPMWKSTQDEAARLNYLARNVMGIQYTTPGGGAAATGTYASTTTGLRNPNASPFWVRGKRWHVTVSFDFTDAGVGLANRLLMGVFNRSDHIGVAIQSHNSPPYNRIGLNLWTKGNQASGGTSIFAATPTVLALNTLHTLTIDYNDGNINVYLNGALEISYTESGSEPYQGTIVSGTTSSNTLVLTPGSYSAFSGLQGYMPISGPAIPAGTWANTTATNGTIVLVDSDYNPVNPISDPTGTTFRLAHSFDTITVLGHYHGYYSVTEAVMSARFASLAYGTGALSANDITGMSAYFNGRTNSAATPSNTTSPIITGHAKVGQVLTCSTGAWTNTPTAYAYQWYSGDMPITGATANTYTPVTANAGDVISCTVTASNAAGPSLPKYVRHRNALANELATIVWDFVTDTVGSAPANITAANSGNILVRNTGAAYATGNYIVDQASTTVTNVYNLTGAQPGASGAPQRIRATFESSAGIGFILQAQTGTTVAGYPGMLQGYYLVIRPNGPSGIYLATSAGLTALEINRYYTWPNKGTYHTQVTWENMRLQVYLSYDGVNYSLVHDLADATYQTATAPCQLITGTANGAPNTTYISQLSYFA